MVSGIFRMSIWNRTIPDHLRGRLASIEMLSYTSGPLLGNAEAGAAAALLGVRASVVSGGVLCVVAVGGHGGRSPRLLGLRCATRSAGIGHIAIESGRGGRAAILIRFTFRERAPIV